MDDTTTLKAAVPTNPLGFLINTEEEGNLSPVIYIESKNQSHNLHFKITNNHLQKLSLKGIAETELTNTKFHFQLTFRPGTLSDSFINKAEYNVQLETGNNSWEAKCQISESNKEVHLNLCYTGTVPVVIEGGASIAIIISEVSSNPIGGSRNTNVFIKFDNLSYSSEVVQSGFQIQHLEVLNHRGQKDIPLKAELIGSNIVLNNNNKNGETNKIRCRILNLGVEPISCQGKDSASPSKFEIKISTATENESLTNFLVKKDKLNDLEFELAGNATDSWELDSDSGHGIFQLVCKEPKILGINDFIEFKFNNIITSLEAGISKILINYYNIPSYRDGQLEVLVEKSPIYFKSGEVGLATNDPKKQLHIKSTNYDKNSGILVEGDNTGISFKDTGDNSSEFKVYNDEGLGVYQVGENETEGSNRFFIKQANGNVGIGTIDPKHILHLNASSDNYLLIQSSNDRVGNKAGIDFSTFIGDGINARIESIDMGSCNGSIAFSTKNTGGKNEKVTEKLRITHDGKVGIGTITPQMAMDVNGEVKAQSFHDDKGNIMPKGAIILWHGTVNDIPRGWALCNGEEGTPNLKGRFIAAATEADNTDNWAYSKGSYEGGGNQVTLTIDQIPPHTHSYASGERRPGEDTQRGGGRPNYYAEDRTTGSAGNGHPFDNRPPFYALCYIMKK